MKHRLRVELLEVVPQASAAQRPVPLPLKPDQGEVIGVRGEKPIRDDEFVSAEGPEVFGDVMLVEEDGDE
ncbi:MAG: hypothetical protein M3P06_03240 [Acidobacteriota bacterium]|nr:hypothetical protein [Acidobacteriota bacterium]